MEPREQLAARLLTFVARRAAGGVRGGMAGWSRMQHQGGLVRHNLRGRAWAALIAALLGLSLVPAIAVLEASPGSAQTATTTCPYPFTNCPTTTTSRRPHPIIIIDVSAVVAGERIHLLVCGLPSGAVVRIT